MLIGFPLLLIPIAIVNIIVFLMPGVSLDTPVYTLPLPSGTPWTFTFSDALLAAGLLLLLAEVAKAARPGAKYFTDHLLSFIVFAGAAAEFLMLPQFGTSTFFLLTMLAFVDVIAGIAVRVRRPKVVAPRTAPVVEDRPPQRAEPQAPLAVPDPLPTAPPRTAQAPIDRFTPVATPASADLVEVMPATAERPYDLAPAAEPLVTPPPPRQEVLAPRQEVLPPESDVVPRR